MGGRKKEEVSCWNDDRENLELEDWRERYGEENEKTHRGYADTNSDT